MYIPNGWRVEELGNVCCNFNYGMNVAANKYDGENKYLRITDIDENSRKFILNDISSPKEKLTDSYLLKENDIVFARTGASVGKTYLYNVDDGKVYYAGYLIRCNIKPEYYAKFVFYQTLTKQYHDWIKVHSARSGQPGVNAEEYKTYFFLCPPLSEQRAIADILTTADQLISLKERLIETKRKQKLWLMQNLLTGKIRLKGFEREWKEVRLGELGQVVAGGTPDTDKAEFWNGDIAWLTPSEVTSKFISETERSITELGLQNSSAHLLPIGSLIICTRATVGTCCINTIPMATNQGFKNLITKNNNVYFLYYLLTLQKKDIIQKAAGSTFLEISKKDIENLIFKAPVLSEQSAIADILATADKELDLLTHELEQQKLVKKYLMQQLLTGRIRVKGASL
jgi:type I restriction enzyme S subunit